MRKLVLKAFALSIPAAAGTALSFAALAVNPAQAATKIIENDSYQSSNQTASVVTEESLSYDAGNLQQGAERRGTIIAQAQLRSLRTFTLRATTNSDGFFSAPHGLPGAKIEGIEVAVQHQNGNWHTLEFSNLVDNRFWFNNVAVQGIINSGNFSNRPVRIILFVRP